MTESLRSFLDRYSDALGRLDVETLAGMYASPCLFVGSGQTAAFTDPRDLLRHLGAVAEERAEQGVGETIPTRVQTIADGGGQTVVLVNWLMERRDGPPKTFHSLYHLVHADGTWRIAVSSSLDR